MVEHNKMYGSNQLPSDGTTAASASGQALTGDQRVPTPGPWKCKTGSAWGNKVVQLRNPSNEICHTSNEADARLIAAAPDMLAALKAMVLNDAHTYRDCHKAALAAIAKATEGQR